MTNKVKKTISSVLILSMGLSPMCTNAMGHQIYSSTPIFNSNFAKCMEDPDKLLKDRLDFYAKKQKDLVSNMSWFQRVKNYFLPSDSMKSDAYVINALQQIKENADHGYGYDCYALHAIDQRARHMRINSGVGGVLSSIGTWFVDAFFKNPMLPYIFVSLVYSWLVRSWFSVKGTVNRALNVKKRETAIQAYEAALRLLSPVKGQSSAVNSIIAEVVSTVEARLAHAQSRATTNGPGARILCFVGGSGNGKTMAAKAAAAAIDGDGSDPMTINATNIYEPGAPVFGPHITRGAQGAETASLSPLLKRVISDKNCVIVINEVDKMPEEQRKKFEEFMRGLVDDGGMHVPRYGWIDFTGVTFIFTSNESKLSYTIGNNEDLQIVDDGTGSRTHITHDKSYVNRIKFIEFDKLDVEAYKAIIVPHLQLLLKRFITEYQVSLNCKLLVNDLAQHIEQLNQGARPVQRYMEKLRATLISELVLKKQNKAIVLFNQEADSFVLVQTNADDSLNLSDNTPEEREFIHSKLSALLPQITTSVDKNYVPSKGEPAEIATSSAETVDNDEVADLQKNLVNSDEPVSAALDDNSKINEAQTTLNGVSDALANDEKSLVAIA